MRDIQTICRTSAIIYAKEMSSKKTETIKLKFIESVFVCNNNKPYSSAEIANAVEESLGLSFTETEVNKIVCADSNVFVKIVEKEEDKYYLDGKRYNHLKNKSSCSIDYAIEKYEKDILRSKNTGFKNLIEKYLYELMNTNIAAYETIINRNAQKMTSRIQCNSFSNEEIEQINSFLKWDNVEKDEALFQLVSFAIEYAITVNNSKETMLANAIRNKVFYLDNALLYRALGINGDVRKKRIISFLKKCKQSGQKLKITINTRKEFLESIDFQISQINNTKPFGRINSKPFRNHTNGSGMYQFYHDWRKDRNTYGFETFKATILESYNRLLRDFDIEEDCKIPYENDNKNISNYRDLISVVKNNNQEHSHQIDAENICWIECLRNGNDISVTDTKYYLITTDQKLQTWDYERSAKQPITLLPSQWMAILLKYVSRTDDDYRSFVSFLNLPHNKSVVEPFEMQEIMAGISEITEDFTKQNVIVDSFIESDLRRLIENKNDLRKEAKEFAKDKIEKEYEEKLKEKELQNQHNQRLSEDIIARIKEETQNELQNQKREQKREKLNQIRTRLGQLKTSKENAENQAHKDLTNFKLKYLIWLLIPVLICLFLSFICNWEVFEVWTYRIAIGSTVLLWLYMAIYGKSFNPLEAFNVKEEELLKFQYQKFQYNQEEYDDLIELKKELENELQ